MRATLDLILATRGGAPVARRHARNAVMRGGAELVGRLFAGQGAPITHMGVGVNEAAETGDFATTALAAGPGPDGATLVAPTEVAIPREAFTVTTDPAARLVLVRVRATLPAAAAVGQVREAGLLAKADGTDPVLYNRVTFDPIDKGDDHELTLFWEVSFPYGDLHWLQ